MFISKPKKAGRMRFVLFALVTMLCSLGFCADSISDSISDPISDPISGFKLSLGKPAAPAKVRITWGEGEIKRIEVSDGSGKVTQSLDPSGDWTNLGAPIDHGRKDIVRAADANFDGAVDLLIESSNGSAGQMFKFFKYDLKTKKLVMSSALDEIWNPRFDEKNKTVLAGANDAKPQTWIWKGDTLNAK